jgi:hypothetical protein
LLMSIKFVPSFGVGRWSLLAGRWGLTLCRSQRPATSD